VVVTITSQITLNEKTIDNKNMEKELELIVDENETLAAKIESKNSIANVEEIAVEQLGMIKLQEYQIHYVNLAEDDSVEIADESEKGSFFDGIVASFNILLEYLN
jgi:cell division protein FtsB